MKEAIVGAIVGMQQCGKTTLAKEESRLQWFNHGRRSLVFDPWLSNWGPWAWVTDDKAKFLKVAFAVHGCAVFWDESSDSLNRNGAEDRGFFTRLRQREIGTTRVGHPVIFVIAHDYAALAPIMRNNLNKVFIFRQNEDRAKDWARQFADNDLLQCAQLARYEFILKRPFEKMVRVKPASIDQLAEFLNAA